MVLSAAQLLKNLEPAIRPGAITPPSSNRATAPLESQSFEQLLALAKSGQFSSGRPVELEFEVQPPLEPAQLDRLAQAADQAEAAGAKNALMLIDGRAFVLDVENRTLTAELSPAQANRMAMVDTAIVVEPDDSQDRGTIAPPSAGILPSGIANQLVQSHNTTRQPHVR
jgi:hypothetical protein